jgi:two-component system, NtrC family, response regulator AtoC
METRKNVLIVDDEENLRHMLSVLLKKSGYRVSAACDGGEALEAASRTRYDFILCDIRMPGTDGLGFLDGAAAAGISSTVIMMSAYGTIDTAIECMKKGAYDYVSKPFNRDEVLLVLRKAEERERLKEENRKLREELAEKYCFGNIVTCNEKMRENFSLIAKVADHRTSVLILGESGTGKELIARALHFSGNRKYGPFIPVNCGAIPENLLESELFGHVKGAFTDASADRSGLFELADGGTLFMDEIGEMPPALQVKLLRVLQENEIRKVGSGETRKVDVRVVSATSKDVAAEVKEGRFREDLYYRVNVFTINVPPLRERMEDVPLLVDHFVAKQAARLRMDPVRVSPEAMKVLTRYSWPGNVRELENCIERAMVLCERGELSVESLPETVRESAPIDILGFIDPDSLSLKLAAEIIERTLIRKALEKTGGNRTHAARILEISHRALLYKLKEYELR